LSFSEVRTDELFPPDLHTEKDHFLEKETTYCQTSAYTLKKG